MGEGEREEESLKFVLGLILDIFVQIVFEHVVGGEFPSSLNI